MVLKQFADRTSKEMDNALESDTALLEFIAQHPDTLDETTLKEWAELLSCDQRRFRRFVLISMILLMED